MTHDAADLPTDTCMHDQILDLDGSSVGFCRDCYEASLARVRAEKTREYRGMPVASLVKRLQREGAR